jgi:4-hydroxy-2-oxoglutarate aldolase
MTSPFSGVYVALTTPFIGDEVSLDKMRDNVRKYNATGLAGYLVLGSTGEGVGLTDDESMDLVEAVVESAGTGKTVLVGTARESTRATLEFTNRAAEAGIAAALVRPPSYYKSRMTRDALRAHYLALAEGSRVPLLIYNIPQNTGFAIETGLVIELSRHANVAGLKESSGSVGYLGEVMREVPEGFSYLLGSGHVLYPGLEMGASGAILAVANAAPELCVKIYDLFRAGRKDESRRRQMDLIPLNKAIMESYGIPGLKLAQDLRGWYGGPARLPLLPVEDKGRAEIAALLQKMGLSGS